MTGVSFQVPASQYNLYNFLYNFTMELYFTDYFVIRLDFPKVTRNSDLFFSTSKSSAKLQNPIITVFSFKKINTQ